MTRPLCSGEWNEETLWEESARTRWGAYVSRAEKRALLRATAWAGSAVPRKVLDIECGCGRWSAPLDRHSNLLVPLCTRLEQALGLRRLTSLSPWIAFVAQRQETENQ